MNRIIPPYNPPAMRHILVLALLALFCGSAAAQQEVRFWHALSGARGGELETLVQRFNASQKEYRVVAEHKGGYEEVIVGALAAQRAGDAPHLVQIYEVGTAQMMAAKSAVKQIGRAHV